MCGSLRLEGQSKVNPINSIIAPQYLLGKNLSKDGYLWNGFARTDGTRDGSKSMAMQWDCKNWQVAAIKASQFTETHKPSGAIHTFNCSRIGCLVNNKTHELKILTRASKTEEEKAIHHRMPSRLPKDWTVQQYTEALNKFTGGQYE